MGAVLALAGCAQRGTPVSKSEAAKLDVGDARISVACGYVEELAAEGRGEPRQRAFIDSVARSGARKLASVYARDHIHIYQGESVGGLLNDGASLLGGCHLEDARHLLEQALGS
jgi:hypothetical protein